MSSKKDFNEAAKLIEDIRADTNTARSSSGNNFFFFNYLNGLINDIKNRKTTKKSVIKKLRGIVSDLDQQRQKKVLIFKIK